MDDGMFWAALAFVWTFWAVTWWGAIKLVDRYNAHNTFGIALAWGVVQVLLAIVLAWLSLFGIGLTVIFMVFLLKLLVFSYEIDLLRSLGVTIVSFVVPYYGGQWMLTELERNRSFALIVLYGFPIAAIVAWRVSRRRERAAEESTERVAMPVAQVRRMLTSITKRRPPKPVAQAKPQPVVAAPSVPAPAPPKPAQPTPAPRADGEPTLLR
jgi:hypothetical protein